MATRLTSEYREVVIAFITDFGYLDDVQSDLIGLCIDAAVEKLYGAGVLVQEDNPEYTEAVMQLAAYRYLRRTVLSTSIGAAEEDKGYSAMVHDYVHRLRFAGGDT